MAAVGRMTQAIAATESARTWLLDCGNKDQQPDMKMAIPSEQYHIRIEVHQRHVVINTGDLYSSYRLHSEGDICAQACAIGDEHQL